MIENFTDDSVCAKKEGLRRHYLALRAACPEEERARLSAAILARTEALKEFQEARTLLVYLPIRGEVDTWPLIRRAWLAGKKVCAPLCDKRTSTMSARLVRGPEDLRKGAYGILEPAGMPQVAAETIDFALIPGCAFSRGGCRLGYGAGYYDRFLAGKRFSGSTAGLCYGFSLADDLPTDEYDRRVDLVATEQELLRIR